MGQELLKKWIKRKNDVAPDNDIPVEVKEQEDQSSEIEKLKKELEKQAEINCCKTNTNRRTEKAQSLEQAR